MARTYGLFFAGYFLQLGIYLPFVSLWLSERAFSATWIGWLIAMPMLVRTLVVPGLSFLADRWQIDRLMVISLALLATICWCLLPFVDQPYMFAVLFVSNAVLMSGILPIMDARAYQDHREGLIRYGQVRLAGSVSFVLIGLLVSPLIQHFQGQSIHIAIALSHVLLVLMLLVLPLRPRRTTADATQRVTVTVRELWPAIRQRRLLLLMVAAGLVQSSHAGLYSLGSVHWSRIGFDETTIALFWAVGVLAEIVFFASMHRAESILTVERLLLMGGLLGLLRWLGLGLTENIFVIIGLQCLHAATFAATHVAGVRLISECLDLRFASTGQAIYASLSMGVFMASLSALSGYAFNVSSLAMYAIMAACCLTGVLVTLTERRLQRLSAGDAHMS